MRRQREPGAGNSRGRSFSAPLLVAFTCAVGAVVWGGERTALLQDSALWPRKVAYRAGSVTPPTQANPESEIACLALNVYFEARGEPLIGKVAVGHVVMNRVFDRRFPTTVCEVVREGGAMAPGKCQFSWWCDGKSDQPRDLDAWAESRQVAEAVYWSRALDPTRGALWYHASWVSPDWRGGLHEGPQFGEHVFYHAEPPSLALSVAAR